MADNDLLPLERVELQCDRCQMNKNAYEYLLTFIKKTTTLQHFSMLSSEIAAHKLQEFWYYVNRDPTLQNKLLENLGLEVTVANNLQMLKREVPKNVSNDEILDFEQLECIKRKISSPYISDLDFEQNNESTLHVDSAMTNLPFSYDIANNVADGPFPQQYS